MAEKLEHRIQRQRNFRPRLDIFDEYDDREFRKRYRVDQNGLMYVTDLVFVFVLIWTTRVDCRQQKSKENIPGK